MRKLLIYLLALLVCTQATAKNIYVSFSGGVDANSGLNTSAPIKTLSRVNALQNAGTIATGDSVLFKCGDTWLLDSLVLTKGINMGSYGTGAQPVISGFYTITSWTNIGNNIYESEALTAPANVSMVVINGKPYAMGRFPNADATNGGYLTFESHGSGYIRDVTGKPTNVTNSTFGGGQVVIRTGHFSIERGNISVINGDTIKYTGTFHSSVQDQFGYFIENDKDCLDQLGEWYYNPTTHKLDVYFPAGPSGFTVKVATKNNLCEPRSNNTSITNISFQGTNQYCIYNNYGGVSGLTIKNCTFQYAGSSHIGLAGRAGVVISNCFFQYAHNNCISMTYHCNKPLVSNNTILDWGQFPGMFYNDANISFRYGFGICFLAQPWENTSSAQYWGGTFSYNTIKRGGYTGIFANGDSNVVTHNYVDTVCTVMDDGGCIYHGNSESRINNYVRIDSNQVFHSLGNINGCSSGSVKQGEGIYWDDNSINGSCKGNTSAHNSHYGIFLHNARLINIQNNTLINNAAFQIAFQHDHVGTFTIDNNTVANNFMFAYTASQRIMYLAKSSDFNESFTTYANWSNNRYCAPFRASGGVETNIIEMNWFGQNSDVFKDLAAWKTFSGKDAGTTATPITITDPSQIIFNVNTNNVAKRLSFCTPLQGVDNATFIKKTTIAPGSSIILLKPVSSGRVARITTFELSPDTLPSFTASGSCTRVDYNSSTRFYANGDKIIAERGTDTSMLKKTVNNLAYTRFTLDSAQSCNVHRTELTISALANKMLSDSIVWIGEAKLIPSTWTIDPTPVIISQLHSSASTFANLDSPPFSLLIYNDSLFAEVAYNTAVDSVIINQHRVFQRFFLSKVPFGKTFSFVAQMKLSAYPKTTGFVKVWIDDNLSLNYSGSFGYVLNDKPFYKTGIYKWLFDQGTGGHVAAGVQSAKLTCYVGDARYGNSLSAYADVRPSNTYTD